MFVATLEGASMLFEIKRCFGCPYFLIGLGIPVLFFAAGYGFQYTASGGSVPLLYWLLDTYTCYTQFGPLVVMAYAISNLCADFSGKTILFYRQLGFSSGSYCAAKLIGMAIPLVVGSLACLAACCALYGDFRPFCSLLVHFVTVLVAYLALAEMMAVVFKSFITAFFVNVAVWIGMAFVTAHSKQLWFVAPFDQNSLIFTTLAQNMADASMFASAEVSNLIIAGVCMAVVAVCALVVCAALRRRWLGNGI